MKKIYAFMASALLAGTAMAAPVQMRDYASVKMSDAAMARSSMRLEQLVNDIENNREVKSLQHKTITIDGVEYDSFLLNHGLAYKVANNWAYSAHLYDIDFIVRSVDNKEYYACSVLWPTQTILNMIDAQSSIEEGGFEIDDTMVPIDEMLAMNEDYIPFKFIYNSPGYVMPFALNEDSYLIGWFMYNCGGQKNDETIKGVDKGAELTVKALDINKRSMDVIIKASILNAPYDDKGSNQVVGTISINYNDGISWMEWTPENREFKISQVHISYTGIYHGTDREQGIKGNWNYYDKYFPDMKRYYINMCNENMTYSSAQWTGKNYPHYHASTQLKLGKENNPAGTTDDPNANFAFIQGSLWTPVDKNTFYYLNYTEVPSEIEYPRIYNIPEPYTTQEAWANAFDFAIWDGMTGAYMSRYTDWYDMNLSIGSKDGLIFTAKDTYQNSYTATFQGQIFFHNDPEDLNKYVLVDATRPEDVAEVLAGATTTVKAANGAIRVSCEGAEDVTIYNPAGAVVATGVANGTAEFAAARGMYLVKVGERTFKVML